MKVCGGSCGRPTSCVRPERAGLSHAGLSHARRGQLHIVQGVIEVQPETLRRAEIWLQSQPLEAVHRKYTTDLARTGLARPCKTSSPLASSAWCAALPRGHSLASYLPLFAPSARKQSLADVSRMFPGTTKRHHQTSACASQARARRSSSSLPALRRAHIASGRSRRLSIG